MNQNTVTVKFDDDALTLAEIVKALNVAGYTVPEHTKVH